MRDALALRVSPIRWCPGKRGTVDDANWAAAHYRVERDSTGLMMSKRKRRRAAAQAAQFGDPTPEEPNDVVRIFDRQGRVVLERDWGRDRPSAMTQEGQIVDDLLRLDVLKFRAKWGIPSPELVGDEAPEEPASSQSPDAF